PGRRCARRPSGTRDAAARGPPPCRRDYSPGSCLPAHGLEAVRAVDGAGAGREEGHLGRLAAVGADDVVHLPRSPLAAVAAAGPAGLPAVVAPSRLVHQPALGIELLLAGGEGEPPPTVAAGQGLVCKAHVQILRRLSSLSLAGGWDGESGGRF